MDQLVRAAKRSAAGLIPEVNSFSELNDLDRISRQRDNLSEISLRCDGGGSDGLAWHRYDGLRDVRSLEPWCQTSDAGKSEVPGSMLPHMLIPGTHCVRDVLSGRKHPVGRFHQLHSHSVTTDLHL